MPYFRQGIFHDMILIFLLLRKCSTCCLFEIVGTSALNVHMVGVAFVVGVVDALHGLAVNADGLAGMHNGTLEGIRTLPLRKKTLAAGAVTVISMLSSNHDVSLAAQPPVVVGTILHCTF